MKIESWGVEKYVRFFVSLLLIISVTYHVYPWKCFNLSQEFNVYIISLKCRYTQPQFDRQASELQAQVEELVECYVLLWQWVFVHDCHQTAPIVLFEILIFSCICVVPFPFETNGCELSDTVSSPKHILLNRHELTTENFHAQPLCYTMAFNFNLLLFTECLRSKKFCGFISHIYASVFCSKHMN